MSTAFTALNYPVFERPDQSLPETADVVIGGAGIMGLATAYYLAKQGLSVVVTDKSHIAGQQSIRAWGWVRQQGRDPAELPLMIAANQLWQTLETELQGDLEWRQEGCMFAGNNESEMATHEDWVETARAHGLDTQLLSHAQTKQLLPDLQTPLLGSLYTPSDGQAEPRRVAPLFAKRAQALGAVLLEGNGITGFGRQNGSIHEVHTERGTIKTRHFVCTAGASSWRLLKSLGIDLPQHIVRGTVSRTSPGTKLSGVTYLGSHIGIRQRKDSSFNLAEGAQVDADITLGHLRGLEWYLGPLLHHHHSFRFNLGSPFWTDLKQRVSRTEVSENGSLVHVRDPIYLPNEHISQRSLAELKREFPSQKEVQIIESWAGGIDVLPDGIPVIDAPAAVPGLLIATGFCGHGFALGPIVGKLLASWITRGEPGMDLHEFRLAKYKEKALKPPHSLF